MNEYNITWTKRNNEDLEYEIEELKKERYDLKKQLVFFEILFAISCLLDMIRIILRWVI